MLLMFTRMEGWDFEQFQEYSARTSYVLAFGMANASRLAFFYFVSRLVSPRSHFLSREKQHGVERAVFNGEYPFIRTPRRGSALLHQLLLTSKTSRNSLPDICAFPTERSIGNGHIPNDFVSAIGNFYRVRIRTNFIRDKTNKMERNLLLELLLEPRLDISKL